MSRVLAIYDSLSLEMRDALRALSKPGALGAAFQRGAAIECGTTQVPVRKQTLQALTRRGLVDEWRAPSGSLRYEITKLGRDVAQE